MKIKKAISTMLCEYKGCGATILKGQSYALVQVPVDNVFEKGIEERSTISQAQCLVHAYQKKRREKSIQLDLGAL